MVRKLIPEFQKPFDDLIEAAHVPPDSDLAEFMFVLYVYDIIYNMLKLFPSVYREWKASRLK